MLGAGSVPEVTATTTVVVVVPFAGSRVRPGVTVIASPEARSVHAPDTHTDVAEVVLQACPSHAASAQSTSPLQSLSIVSVQLVSVVALAGLRVHAGAALHADGEVAEQVPVPPAGSVQERPAHPVAAPQFVPQADARETKLTDAVVEPLVLEAVTVAAPAHPTFVPESQVVSVTVAVVTPEPAGTTYDVTPPGNVPRLAVRVTAAAPVSLTVKLTVFVPFATTEVAEGVSVMVGAAGAGECPPSSCLQPATDTTRHSAAAIFQIRAFICGVTLRGRDAGTRSGHLHGEARCGQVADFTGSAGYRIVPRAGDKARRGGLCRCGWTSRGG
jgi:hypothetical protein